MPRRPGFSRLDRVAASVKKALAAPLNDLVRTQAGALASITEVELAPDLRRGIVYLSLYGDALDKPACLRNINARAADLQGELAVALRTKRTPVLQFRLDEAIERGDRIARLLQADGRSESAS